MAYTLTKDLQTGHNMIDHQHKEWMDALNKLLAACQAGKGRDSIRPTLMFLVDYTRKHFSDEEALQKQTGYPGYAQHKQYHDAFCKVLNDIVEELEKTGPTVVLVGKVNSTLGSWFVNHIAKEDKKVAKHVQETQKKSA